MKYLGLYIALPVIMFACSPGENEPTNNPNKCSLYACPIHPDITSTTLEKCPTCNTLMIPADSLKKDSLKHSAK